MSILIKGMEMPDGCPFCPLSHWTRGTDEFAGCEIVPGKRYAMLNDKAFAASPAKSRPDWCPLVSVPPHGRLIDADVLGIYQREERARQEYERDNSDEYLEGILDGLHEAAKQLSTAPTIIEAEEEQE